MKTKLITIIFLCLVKISFAQFWQGVGNPPCPASQCVGVTTNFVGTDANDTTWLRMGVNGSQDIFIDNLAGVPQILGNCGTVQEGGHWVGLGRIFKPSTGPGANTFLSPKAHLHINGGDNSGLCGFTGALRPWFQTGVLSTENSDGMYVGLRDLKSVTGLSNSSYAVINWCHQRLGATYLN